MSCKCAKFHSFIIKGTTFTPNRWTIRGTNSSFLSEVICFQLQPFLPWLLLAGNEDDSGLASIKRRLESCFSWAKYSLADCVKISGNEADLRKAPVAKFALRVGASETRLAATELTYAVSTEVSPFRSRCFSLLVIVSLFCSFPYPPFGKYMESILGSTG